MTDYFKIAASRNKRKHMCVREHTKPFYCFLVLVLLFLKLTEVGKLCVTCIFVILKADVSIRTFNKHTLSAELLSLKSSVKSLHICLR